MTTGTNHDADRYLQDNSQPAKHREFRHRHLNDLIHHAASKHYVMKSPNQSIHRAYQLIFQPVLVHPNQLALQLPTNQKVLFQTKHLNHFSEQDQQYFEQYADQESVHPAHRKKQVLAHPKIAAEKYTSQVLIG